MPWSAKSPLAGAGLPCGSRNSFGCDECPHQQLVPSLLLNVFILVLGEN